MNICLSPDGCVFRSVLTPALSKSNLLILTIESQISVVSVFMQHFIAFVHIFKRKSFLQLFCSCQIRFKQPAQNMQAHLECGSCAPRAGLFVVLMVGPPPSCYAPHFILLNHPSKFCPLWEDLVNSFPHSELLAWKFVNITE